MSKLFFKLFTVLAIAMIGSVESIKYSDSNTVNRFNLWVEKFKIKISDEHHFAHMLSNWKFNDKFITETNGQNLTYTLGHNVYSGLSSQEFSEFMGFKANRELFSEGPGYLSRFDDDDYVLGDMPVDLSALPTTVDWRTKGVVGSVRDQGNCGSCWAFSGTSTLESAVAIKTGKLYDLSEQQSVSCSTVKNGYSNLGCNGGMYDVDWKYVTDNGGLCSESTYSYTSGTTGQTGTCMKTCSVVAGTKVTNHVVVTPYSDSAMMSALTISPVSIALEADTPSFQLYKSGIYSDYAGCGGQNPDLDHAVVLVGYSTSSTGQDYYIMRNSWGVGWGDQDSVENKGYMLMARGSSYGKAGLCGLLSEPMYPTV